MASKVTHYVPAFAESRRGTWGTVCGQWVPFADHSVEPTCPACAAWLTQDATDYADTAAALEAEFPEFKGKLLIHDTTATDDAGRALFPQAGRSRGGQ